MIENVFLAHKCSSPNSIAERNLLSKVSSTTQIDKMKNSKWKQPKFFDEIF